MNRIYDNNSLFKSKVKRNSFLILIRILPKKFVISELQLIQVRKLFKFILIVKNKFYSPDTVLFSFKDNHRAISSSVFSNNNLYLATVGLGGDATVYDINPFHKLTFGTSLVTFRNLVSFCFSPNDVFFVINGKDFLTTIYKINGVTLRENQQLSETENFMKTIEKFPTSKEGIVLSTSFTSDNKFFCLGLANGTVQVYAIQQKQNYFQQQRALNQTLTFDGRTGGVNSDSYTTLECDYSLKLIKRLNDQFGSITCLLISSNDRFLVTGGYDTNVFLYTLDTLQEKVERVKSFKDQKLPISSLCYSEDNSYLTTVSMDLSVCIYSIIEDSTFGRLIYNSHSISMCCLIKNLVYISYLEINKSKVFALLNGHNEKNQRGFIQLMNHFPNFNIKNSNQVEDHNNSNVHSISLSQNNYFLNVGYNNGESIIFV